MANAECPDSRSHENAYALNFYSSVGAKTVTLQQCNLADMLIGIYNNAQSKSVGGGMGEIWAIIENGLLQHCPIMC